MNDYTRIPVTAGLISLFALTALPAAAENPCQDLPDHATLTRALKQAVVAGDPKANGGFALNMWATVVARDGAVCAVTFTGPTWRDQWLGSRIISAQKANTANAFSLPRLALSTANLYSAVQSGGSLFGLQFSNPVDPAVAYAGDANRFGQADDPLVGQRIGGVNVFGGGLALYTAAGQLVGGLGVSGDTSCADHNVAWKTRQALGLHHVPAGVNPASGAATGNDNILYDVVGGQSASGFGHPDCGRGEKAVAATLTTPAPAEGKP